jgi:hypothetical protein
MLKPAWVGDGVAEDVLDATGESSIVFANAKAQVNAPSSPQPATYGGPARRPGCRRKVSCCLW